MDGSHREGKLSSDIPHTSASNMHPPGSSHHGAALPQVPPEAYTSLIHALLSMQGVIPPSPAHVDQSVPYPQVLFPGPFTSSIHSHASHQMHSSSSPAVPSTQYPHLSPSDSLSMRTPHSASFHANAPLDPDDAVEEAALVTEDKRRRNTSASARFRIKKKQRTLNLERTVSDLTGRINELEREASDLRRENSWLKEIVLLKSRNTFSSSPSSSDKVEDTRPK